MTEQKKEIKFEEEFNYYLNNIEDFVKDYDGKYIVLKGHNLLGAYDSFNDAINETRKTEELGTFFVQLCSKNEESYTQTYHSRVMFN